DLLSCVKDHLQRAGRQPADVMKAMRGVDEDTRNVCAFSLYTHGFGPLAAAHVIESLITVIKQFHSLCPTEQSIRADFAHFSQSTTTEAVATKKDKKDSSNEIDPSIISPRSSDFDIYDSSVLPRIGYDNGVIEMTVGEMRRRILGPEKLTASQICAYLRKAKNQSSLPVLRENLEKCGVIFSDNNKSIHPNTLTSLSETEAIALAIETGTYLNALPPSREMKDNVRNHPAQAYCLRMIAKSIEEAMTRVGRRPEDRNVETVADLHLLRFSMVSHHFGHNFYASVMRWLQYSMS
ncbi:hypothetical protein PENTCL1PPCAC_26839, partial [Pristionchus entomophagus]